MVRPHPAPAFGPRAALTVYDADGLAIKSFHVTGADLEETPLGFELRVQDVAGCDRFAGRCITAELVIDFDQDGDTPSDSASGWGVEIEGVLPEGFDF